jgi:hypothetical protein
LHPPSEDMPEEASTSVASVLYFASIVSQKLDTIETSLLSFPADVKASICR